MHKNEIIIKISKFFREGESNLLFVFGKSMDKSKECLIGGIANDHFFIEGICEPINHSLIDWESTLEHLIGIEKQKEINLQNKGKIKDAVHTSKHYGFYHDITEKEKKEGRIKLDV